MVLGLDGLPLMEPANPSNPYQELQSPGGLQLDESEPLELPPSPTTPEIPVKPPEMKPQQDFEPKRRKSPMAEAGRDETVTEIFQPPRIIEAGYEVPPSPADSDISLPVPPSPAPYEGTSTQPRNDNEIEFKEPIVPAAYDE